MKCLACWEEILEESKICSMCGSDQQDAKDFLTLAHQLGMSAILEVHNDEDLKKVLITEAKIIGINNRNLKTLKVDLGTTLKLREKIPSGKIVVSESGIKDYEDIQLLKKCGIDAILVGESLLQSKNIGKKIRELIGEENDQNQGLWNYQ